MKISSCEKDFTRQCVLKNGKRLDGRSLSIGRTLEIIFGQEWGCCIVSLGYTRVLGQVSAEITDPKSSTPTEGSLNINLEVSQMCAPNVKSRMSDECVEIQRCLERCIRDSKCIDLESLCIIAGSKVWTVRVDVNVLNDDGNVIECASIASISALAHFKRPDVTVVGTEVSVHPLEDREPIPLSIHHMPVAICLALFQSGEKIIVDPSELEARVADGCYVIGMNAHQEICFVHRQGALVLKLEIITKCENMAVLRAQTITQDIRKALDDDLYKRNTKVPIGFVNMLQTSTILGAKHPIHNFKLESITTEQEVMEVAEDKMITNHDSTQLPTVPIPINSGAHLRALKILEQQQQSVFEGGASKWGIRNDSDTSSEEDNPVENVSTETQIDVKTENLSSEEEELAVVDEDQLDVEPNNYRGWYTKNPFA